MKHLQKIILLLCLFPLTVLRLQAQDKPAYALFDDKGNSITYRELIRQLARHDVVFLGEMHNCPVTHWLEYEITRSLHAIHKDKLVIGAEMFESDNQLIIDEYMQGYITEDRFEAETRLWDNYFTDYRPVVWFAKKNAIPFVATNIPRRYANSVKNRGLEALDAFSDEARTYMAPLPIPFEYDEEKSRKAFGMMLLMGGKTDGDLKRLAQAQAIKDATMAWFIARNLSAPNTKLLHLNGSYHSDFKEGIILYLLEYRPGTSCATVTFLRQEDISRLDSVQQGRADFYVVIPDTMVTSY